MVYKLGNSEKIAFDDNFITENRNLIIKIQWNVKQLSDIVIF